MRKLPLRFMVGEYYPCQDRQDTSGGLCEIMVGWRLLMLIRTTMYFMVRFSPLILDMCDSSAILLHDQWLRSFIFNFSMSFGR